MSGRPVLHLRLAARLREYAVVAARLGTLGLAAGVRLRALAAAVAEDRAAIPRIAADLDALAHRSPKREPVTRVLTAAADDAAHPRRCLGPADRRRRGGFAALPVEARRKVQDAGHAALRARPMEQRRATARKIAEIRRQNGNQKRGEAHQCAKLSDAQVVEIRRLWDGGEGPTQGQLADQFGVSRKRINLIVLGKVRQDAAPQAPLAPPPSPIPADERALILRYQAGDNAAGTILLQRYEPFIRSIACRYWGTGLDKDDLLQEGRDGFLHGVRLFDLTRGTVLTTYAGDWVRARIGRAIADTGRLVRVPVGLVDKIRRARRHGITDAAGLVAAGVTDPERAAAGVTAMRRAMSVDAPTHDGADDRLGDVLAAPGPSPEELAETEERQRQAKAAVARLLATLKPRERLIVTARVMVADGDEQTLDQVGQRLGLSKERIRQIEAAVMQKLRIRAAAEETCRG